MASGPVWSNKGSHLDLVVGGFNFYVHLQKHTFEQLWSLVWLKSFSISCSCYYPLGCDRVSHTVQGAQPTQI